MEKIFKHRFNHSIKDYIEKAVFCELFNDWLYKKIDYKQRKLIELKKNNKSIKRVTKLVPERQMPELIKKVIKHDTIEYIEETNLIKETNIVNFSITPNVFKNRFSCNGKIVLIPNDKNGFDRELIINISIKVLGISKIMEKFIFEQIRHSFDKGTEYTFDYLNEKLYIDPNIFNGHCNRKNCNLLNKINN